MIKNESDPKLKPKTTCSLSPSHASGSLYNFILSLSCTLGSFYNKFCLTHYPALAVANGHLKTPVFLNLIIHVIFRNIKVILDVFGKKNQSH